MMTDVTDANREAAETLRDGMINVARSLADRDCGATQSEMRDAQIEYLIVHREASIAPYVEALREAREHMDHVNCASEAITMNGANAGWACSCGYDKTIAQIDALLGNG